MNKVWFRPIEEATDELRIAKEYVEVAEFSDQLDSGDTVLQRYTTLPFPELIYNELDHLGIQSVNTLEMHRYAADAMAWSKDLEGMTPATYDNWYNLPKGSYVVKGKTNSRKFKWNTHMFAETIADVPVVAGRLLDDSLIGQQGLVVRDYVPLMSYGEGINGSPIAHEIRTFWLNSSLGDYATWPELMGIGWYWATELDLFEDVAMFTGGIPKFFSEAAERVSKNINFFVLDFALTESGEWIVIELNDGQMSGLGGVDANMLYDSIAEVFNNK